MPQVPQKLNAGQPIVLEDFTMFQTFRNWARCVSDALPIVNTGSPEGVVEAAQYALYIDEAIPLTPVQYRKMLPDIGGDRTQGWAVI